MQPLGAPSLPALLQQTTDSANETGVRIGTVTSFTAGLIIVAISGSNTLVNAFYLASYYPNVGDVVAVIRSGATWIVLNAISSNTSRGAPVSATVTTSESTGSTSFTNLATVGPTVTAQIGSSGKALVLLSAWLVGAGGTGCYMGVAVSGATTIAPDDARALQSSANSTFTLNATRCLQFAAEIGWGLNPGLNTFTAKYESGLASPAANFSDRNITVIPY